MAPSRAGLAIPAAFALGLSLALAQSAPPKTSRDWKRLRSVNFAAVGNASEAVLRQAVSRLEGFRQALLSQFPRLQLDSPVPTVMVVFKDDESFSRFKPRDDRGRRLDGVAIETDPANYSGNFYLASAFSKAKNHEEAARSFDRTVALNIKAEPAWFGLSVAEMALGRDQQADAALAQVLRLNSDPRWYRRRLYEALKLRRDAVAAKDARAFLRLAGWGDESAPYVALAAVVAGWRLGQPAEVSAIIEEAKRVVKTDSWTAALLEFAAGQLPADNLIARAKDVGQRTEAHAYVGIKAAVDGRKDEALVHLRWVKEKGRKGYVEYEWAIDELQRLEAR